jgi:5-formyltetrahydrofolate cyclo-ligase
MNQKSQLRKNFLMLRNALSDEERQYQESEVLKILLLLSRWTQAKKIGVYLSFKGEFSTRAIIQNALASDKIVYAPIVTDQANGLMRFQQIALKDNAIEFLENDSTTVQPIDLDCMLVPLLAFDKHHYRLGMGGGFYDRYLSLYQTKKPWLLGLAYEEQYCEHLPHDNWDQPLDTVVTPSGFC